MVFERRTNLREYLLALAGVALILCAMPAPAQQLDKLIAEGKSRRELARYLFNTHGCKSCHTMGQNGKLGFTEKGKERAKGFEGCISMLTAMNLIAQVDEKQRSPQQREKAARFEEFGCTTCHKIVPGKMGLTDAGERLTHLHLGCVDVEKLVATRH
jgi:cytochrome c551/c552